MSDQILNISEAAKMLRLDRGTLKDLAENGDVPGAKFGTQWRFLRSALENYLSQPARRTAEPETAQVA